MKPVLTTAALILLMVTALAGVAWAASAIECEPGSDHLRPCEGTSGNDVLRGTNRGDVISGGHRGADIIYGKGENDYLIGGVGPDTVHGGPGDDDITNQETDYPFGRDANYGGPGDDSIYGNISPERHYGGRGNDYITDHQAGSRNPDVFRCGSGRDYVLYNKGLDKG